MRPLASAACLVLAVATLSSTALTGCGPRGAAVFVTGVFVGAALASHEDHEVIVYEPSPVVIAGPYEYVPPPAPPARERVPTDPPPATFDIGAARNSLGAARVARCRAEGAPRGYGHARVTFTPGGNVSRVVVESPTGMSPDAVACIGRELGGASVPPFDGRDVTVGTGWLIR
jgi:hypothetical protein